MVIKAIRVVAMIPIGTADSGVALRRMANMTKQIDARAITWVILVNIELIAVISGVRNENL